MKLFLDRNLAQFGSSAKFMGFKLTHYITGLDEDVFDRIKDWENTLARRLEGDSSTFEKKVVNLIEYQHNETENEWDAFHCFIGIRNTHAVLYFIPIEGRETVYQTTGWHQFSSSFAVDALRIHLAISEEDKDRYAVKIDKLERQFEDIQLFLCCNILTSFKALQVLAYATAIQIGNYRELESDCLEFCKTAANLAKQHFATAKEFEKSRVNIQVREVMGVDSLTVTDFKSEALSRRYQASRYSGISSLVTAQSSCLQILIIVFVCLFLYHFLFAR